MSYQATAQVRQSQEDKCCLGRAYLDSAWLQSGKEDICREERLKKTF